jgi:hypothetical protein
MKPFHSVLGALGWVEINARGPVCCRIMLLSKRGLQIYCYEFVEYMQGWVERRCK